MGCSAAVYEARRASSKSRKTRKSRSGASKRKSRKSKRCPSTKASAFKSGSIRLGRDGRKWVVRRRSLKRKSKRTGRIKKVSKKVWVRCSKMSRSKRFCMKKKKKSSSGKRRRSGSKRH